jgi:putative PIN family toxin of toxin-antitoxin system
VRIVLDSSVLVAAHITRAGVCAELFEDVLMQHHLVISRFILDELARKLTDKFDFDQSMVRQIVRFISRQSTVVEPATLPQDVCRDPEDIPVLGTAVSGEVALLITVDKDLLTLEEYSGISIVRPGEFWRRVE